MSNAFPVKPRIITPKVRISIVASKYNEQFTDALVENAVSELKELVPNAKIEIIRVPGAFEVPTMVAKVMSHNPPSCVIALGLIIRGATQHADLIGSSVTQALQTLAIQHAKPVIHEVLLLDNDKQAFARCIGDELNRGREAARAAASMIDVMAEYDRTHSTNPEPSSTKNRYAQ